LERPSQLLHRACKRPGQPRCRLVLPSGQGRPSEEHRKLRGLLEGRRGHELAMATPSIARLGHVGIHCKDLGKQKAFYSDVLGLQITNEDMRMGMVFLSARPEEEDHELLLCGGRTTEDVLLLQQMSWRCNE